MFFLLVMEVSLKYSCEAQETEYIDPKSIQNIEEDIFMTVCEIEVEKDIERNN